jgi:hypothetical protein
VDCRIIQQNLDEYRDGLLGKTEQQEFRAHLAQCADCRGRLARLQGFIDSMQRMPVTPPHPGFLEQALREAQELHQSNPVRLPAVMKHRVSMWLATGVGGALAASVLVWVIAALPKPVPSGVPAVEFGLNQTRSIQLAFDTPEAFHGVTLTVVVPANFQIAKHPGQHQLSWRTDLHKGANVLTLPVVAVQTGNGELVARLSNSKQSKSFRVPLSVRASNDSGSISTETN